ncbi:MAG: alginate O-acetyltransferase AlgX-related protein [Planctomycetota bacterium]|jgi:hypothetical protein
MAEVDVDRRAEASRLRRALPNLLLVAFSLLLSFVVLEVAVRLFVDLQEYRPIGVHDVDPEDGTRFLPGHERVYETAEFRYTVTFNRFGRRDIEWTPAMIADPHNILFIGDSFVLGNGVEHESTVASLLEKRFAAAGDSREVFNFGMPAGAPPTYERMLRSALDSGFGAKTVLVATFVGNDFYPNVLAPPKPRPRPKPKTNDRGAGPRSELAHFVRLRLSQSPRTVGWALTASRLLGVTAYDTAGSYIFLRKQTPEQSAVFDEILESFGRLKERCDADGRELRLVIFPNKIQVENREDLTSAVFDAEKPNRRILDYCAAHGIPCLDLLPVIEAGYERGGESLYFPVDRHLNETGSAVAAEAIGDFLEEGERRS